MEKRLPRVVIVGCGFGGLFAARALRKAPIELVVVDRNNYHLFQPLLYQVASAALSPANIAQAIRSILRGQKNTLVMLETANRVALDENCLHFEAKSIQYDYLILAPGAVDNYFGHAEWRRFAPGMKEVEDATAIRSRLLLSFETAELEADPQERAAHLSFVIVGGGPTGVELAGAIKELAVDVIPRDFRKADTRTARVTLIEAGDRLLSGMHPDSSARALKQLEDLGVEVRLRQRVTSILKDGVQIGDTELLRSHNVIWCAGVRAAPLIDALGVEQGPGGRAKVQPDCSLPGHPNVFVIGDAAFVVDPVTHKPVPGVSQAALQMGRYVARVIASELKGDPNARKKAFHYKDLGAMATVGKSRAVVELGRLRFGGFIAWVAWLTLHITVLIGFRNRLAVFASWVHSYMFFRRGSRLITGMDALPVKTFAIEQKADTERRSA
jgi:NADH:ubiquinone reductase (H+-translocating)